MKFKFAGFLKHLFQKSGSHDAPAKTVAPEESATAWSAAFPPATPAANATNGNGNGHGAAPVNGLAIPLQTVLAGFSLELRGKIRQANTGDLTVTVAFDKILSQLSSGVVRVNFGDIRRAAPQVFAPGIESDAVPVSLPLNEILSRLNPALLTRRPVQKKIEVPAEIDSPFAGNGQGAAFVVGNTQPEAPAVAAPAPPRARPAFTATPASKPGETSTFKRVTPKTMLPAAAHAASVGAELEAPIFQRKPVAPSASVSPVTPPPAAPPQSRVAPTDDDAPIFQRKPLASEPAASAAPPRPRDFLSHPPVARSVQPARTAAPAPSVPEVATLPLPLTALADAWPDAVRHEIVQLNLVDARVALPADLVEASLKRGRVAFPWKTVRSWIRPALHGSISAHDTTDLELPLSVIAPLFLARQKAAGKQQRTAIDETIPNLFFGLPKPEPATTPKPADTNYYIWGDTNDNARVDDTDVKRKGPSGTDFVSRYATPNEIVSRAAVLEGVAGVLIALPDGLMVASRIPPEFNGDTLAAFLPQIFSKVSGCTKELRMGDLNNLNFTVGNTPWKIFRVNAIFFAAFGRTGEALPTAELAGLAAELDRKRTA
ncbi:MAG: roadblock/LC7 domain-containing protein [Pedosphaera sp.]|nr:roadblock/LC7 domain-containing protein [Pedosphaera sp.]